jgi:hypothetical protein
LQLSRWAKKSVSMPNEMLSDLADSTVVDLAIDSHCVAKIDFVVAVAVVVRVVVGFAVVPHHVERLK